jgi:hypothetical protein
LSSQECSPAEDSRITPFLTLLAKTKEDWQVNQARDALRLYHFYLAHAKNMNNETKLREQLMRARELFERKNILGVTSPLDV